MNNIQLISILLPTSLKKNNAKNDQFTDSVGLKIGIDNYMSQTCQTTFRISFDFIKKKRKMKVFYFCE